MKGKGSKPTSQGGSGDAKPFDVFPFLETLSGSKEPTDLTDGFAVIIARRDGAKTKFLASSSNRDLVKTVAETAVNDNTFDPKLRTFVEVAQSQAYPVKALPAKEDTRREWLLKHVYADKSLHFDDKAIVLTRTKGPGVTTRLVPKEPIIKRTASLAEADVLQLEMWGSRGIKLSLKLSH